MAEKLDKKLLYVSGDKTVAYDKDHCYCDGESRDAGDAWKDASIFVKQRVSDELEKLLGNITNVAVLTAAGTSLDNYDNSGKTRVGLWEHCKAEIEAIAEIINLRGLYEKIEKSISEMDIEGFLSYLLLYEKVNGALNNADGVRVVDKLEKKISEACNLKLDQKNTHHGMFLRKLTSRKLTFPRLELFTLNYDTLFEQAAQNLGFTLIDGFSFSYPRKFSGRNFNYDIVCRDNSRLRKEENFAPNVLKLFKLHGSIDWKREGDFVYQMGSKTDKPCVVYPASDKYESSYEQPYFEMMSHFQQTLRKEGTLLIVVGFGFQDKHIQNVIKEAIATNSNFHLMVVYYKTQKTPEGTYEDTGIVSEELPEYIIKDGKTQANVTVVFSKFKDFVDMIPQNKAYDNLANNRDEAV